MLAAGATGWFQTKFKLKFSNSMIDWIADVSNQSFISF